MKRMGGLSGGTRDETGQVARGGDAPGAQDAPAIECQHCPVGAISGIQQAQFCPFIVREYPREAVLYRAGEAADYIWYIRSGVIQLTGEDGVIERRQFNSFIGTEAMETGHYRATAEVCEPAVLCGATREGFARWMASHTDSLCVVLCRAFDPGS